MSVHRIRVFKRFERIWHWSQMGLIFTLIFTGFAIHGVYDLVPFGTAVTVHTWAAILLFFLWAFAIFWLFTTGQWRHYLFPAAWISGIAYLLISFGQQDLLGPIGLGLIAMVHTIAAIAIVVFVIVHVYLLTTGHSFSEHVKPMITGYDKVELSDEELAYLRSNEPDVLKG